MIIFNKLTKWNEGLSCALKIQEFLFIIQYTHYFGRSYLFPYWSLGFQICRYGYQNTAEIEEVVEENREYRIPYDIQYADIDYMERQLDFTLDEINFSGLPDLINKVRDEYNMRFIIILDPAVSTDEGDDESKDRLKIVFFSITKTQLN